MQPVWLKCTAELEAQIQVRMVYYNIQCGSICTLSYPSICQSFLVQIMLGWVRFFYHCKSMSTIKCIQHPNSSVLYIAEKLNKLNKAIVQ